jgi:hypothetical protein
VDHGNLGNAAGHRFRLPTRYERLLLRGRRDLPEVAVRVAEVPVVPTPLSGCCLLHDAATGGRVAITTAIATIGRTAGPPWAADQRHAAAAAWLALS